MPRTRAPELKRVRRMRALVLEFERTMADGNLTLAVPSSPGFTADELDIAAARIESACLHAMIAIDDRDADVYRFLNSWMRAAKSVRGFDDEDCCLNAQFCGRALGAFLPEQHQTATLARLARTRRGGRAELVQAAFFAGLSEGRLASNVRRLHALKT